MLYLKLHQVMLWPAYWKCDQLHLPSIPDLLAK